MRTLFARLDNAGDVILTGPAVRALAAHRDEVVFLCGPNGRDAAHLLPDVASVHVYDAPWIPESDRPVQTSSDLGLVERLRRLAVDELVISTSFHQSPLPLALLGRLAGISRVGAISVDQPGSLLDVRHLVDDDVHEVVRNLSLVEAMGATLPPGDEGELRLGSRLPAWWEQLPERYVVLAPGASVPARAWTPRGYRTVALELARRGHAVVVTGTASQRDLTAFVAGDHGIDLGGRTPFAELVAVVGRSQAVVTGNSGTAHVAAATRRPTVTLHAPTVPVGRWGPWKTPHVVLGDQGITCAGCRARECPVSGHPCIDDVDPDVVIETVLSISRLAPGPQEVIPA